MLTIKEYVDKYKKSPVSTDIEGIIKKHKSNDMMLKKLGFFFEKPIADRSMKNLQCACGKTHSMSKGVNNTVICNKLGVKISGRTKKEILQKWIILQVGIIDNLEETNV